MDFDSLYEQVNNTYNSLKDENDEVWRSSTEYKEAMKSCETLLKSWETISSKVREDPEYRPSDREYDLAMNRLEDAAVKLDTYIDKKEQEAEAKGDDFSATSQNRLDTAKEAREVISGQLTSWVDYADTRNREQPQPSAQELGDKAKNAKEELADANEGVHFGSKAYSEVMTQASKIEKKWNDLTKDKDRIPTPGEISEMRADLAEARIKAEKYLQKKDGTDDLGPKTEKRVRAAEKFKDTLDMQQKMLSGWMLENEKKAKNLSVKEQQEKTEELQDKLKEADKDVTVGSSEYREVKSLLAKQKKKLDEIAKKVEKDPEYKMSTVEAKELEDINSRITRQTNSYLSKKAQLQDISPTTRKRMDAMREVKDHTFNIDKMLGDRQNKLETEANKAKDKDLTKESRDISKQLKEANKHVYNGSQKYDDAMEAYNRSYVSWSRNRQKAEEGKLTPEDREKESRALESTMKKIDDYLKYNKNKDLEKHPKTKKRMEAMEKARKNCEIRHAKLQVENKKERQAEAEAQKKRNAERVNTHKTNLRTGTRIQKMTAKASLAADERLNQLSKKSTLSARERRQAREAIAAKLLEERLKYPAMAQMKEKLAKNPKLYKAAIKKIANSPEFKKSLPNSRLTPANMKNFASNPKTIEREAKEFNKELVKTSRAETARMQNQAADLKKEQKKDLKPLKQVQSTKR